MPQPEERKRKTLIGIVATAVITAAAVVVLLVAPIAPRLTLTRLETVDRDFDGIFTDRTKTSESKTIRLLIVHGIGRHCIGYADSLATGIARQVGMTYAQPMQQLFRETDCTTPILDYNKFENSQLELCELINNQKQPDRTCQYLKLDTDYFDKNKQRNETSASFPGYLRTQDYRWLKGSNDSVKLRLYELTWDPATRWAKSYYVNRHDSEFDGDREIFNRSLKQQVINESISDAVLYLGDYRPVMLYPIVMAFCKMLSDGLLDGDSETDDVEFACNLEKLTKALNQSGERLDDDEVIVITHSLGSRMTFDALGAIAGPDFVNKARNDLKKIGVRFSERGIAGAVPVETQEMAQRFRGLITKVFVLSNQVPLLELGTIKNPVSFNLEPDLGERFAEFLQQRVDSGVAAKPLQLVSFTDPNDLLSYNLKCWYYLHVLKHHTDIRERKRKDPKLHDKYFDRCTLADGDPLLDQKKEMRDGFWALAEPYVKITDVSAYLAGPGYPYVFADPASAHSKYFDDEMIFQLVACGASKETKRPKDCPTE